MNILTWTPSESTLIDKAFVLRPTNVGQGLFLCGSSPVFTSCFASLHLHFWHVQSLSRAKQFSNKAERQSHIFQQQQGKPRRLSVTYASCSPCRLTLVPPHHIVCGELAFSLSLIYCLSIHNGTFPIRSTLHLVNGLRYI